MSPWLVFCFVVHRLSWQPDFLSLSSCHDSTFVGANVGQNGGCLWTEDKLSACLFSVFFPRDDPHEKPADNHHVSFLQQVGISKSSSAHICWSDVGSCSWTWNWPVGTFCLCSRAPDDFVWSFLYFLCDEKREVKLKVKKAPYKCRLFVNRL